MERQSIVFDEKTLQRIPPLFVFVLIMILGLPIVLMNYFQGDFTVLSAGIRDVTGLTANQVEFEIRGYFRQTLLEWSAFSLSAITVLLAFTQFRLTNDKIALVIGFVVLFSGSVQAIHTLSIDSLKLSFLEQKNLDAVIWTFTNTMTAVIFIVGLLIALHYKSVVNFRVSTFFLINFLLLLIAFSIIYYAASRVELPDLWYPDQTISRPYELVYLFLNLIIIFFIYPKVYKQYQNILTNGIFYMAFTQIVMALYIMILSSSPYDSAYNIAYFIKIIFYFIPLACLIINYVYSYNTVLEGQKRLKLSQEQLQYMASHDELTNLFNRREFEKLLDISVANFKREKSSFALFVIDIDNFKTINDSLGHAMGDLYIKKFSEHLSSLTRKGDVVSRIGGDEYTIITGKIESIESIKVFAERIVENINTPLAVNDKLLTCTASIGVAIFPKDGNESEGLFKSADIAMYASKRSGKNGYYFYEEKMGELNIREAEIKNYLQNVLTRNELSLSFQPKFNLKTREIVGAEALLRWHNNYLGDISPSEFIHIAEQTGKLIQIGEWVIHKTLEYSQQFAKIYTKPLIYAVNISPSQIINTAFNEVLKQALQRHNYPPKNFEIEISETLLLSPYPEVNKILESIDSMGVNIIIDDFGMGYSSITKLKSLPIKTIKIDRDFIAEITKDKEKVIVIDTIIKLSKELNIDIVAEGIETELQLNYLLKRNCLIGQGYYLCKPLTPEQFEKYLRKKNDALDN